MDALLRCQACGAVNRLKRERLAEAPRCGRCHAAIDIPRRPRDLGAALFSAEVLSWPGAALVEFWSPLCGHCLTMNPILDDLAAHMAGMVKFVKINILQEQQLSHQYGITGTPTFMLFVGGTIRQQIAGALKREQLQHWIEAGLY